MLVLARKTDEKIRIGDDITITVIETRYGKVRLGITAPSHIPVHREEIYQTIKSEGQNPKDR